MSGAPLDGSSLSSEQLILGSLMLELISDWDAWVSRRVDRFSFIGDDERQLRRHQSLDFNIPTRLRELEMPLLDELGGFPIPVTFAGKWRLPDFSLRDGNGNVVSLVQREQSIQLSTAMLIALGALLKTDELGSLKATPAMPGWLQRRLGEIPPRHPDACRRRRQLPLTRASTAPSARTTSTWC